MAPLSWFAVAAAVQCQWGAANSWKGSLLIGLEAAADSSMGLLCCALVSEIRHT